ncbi:F0F1 ATP synthase subunit B family protein [Rhizobium binxianense]
MHIDWWTLGLQTVNVLVLIWLLQRFLLKPVAGIIDARQAAAAKLMTDAEAVRTAAEADRQKAAAEVASIAAGRGETLKAAAAEAETTKAALLAEARAEAEKLRAAATAEIERSRKDSETAYADHAKLLAVEIARRLFARLPDEARIAGFIDGFAEALSALPPESRNAIGDGSPLKLRVPRMLTSAEKEACRTKLSVAFGRAVDIAFIPDSDIIAGLEIDTPHALVRNSFRADLDRIAQELSHGSDR